MCGRLQRKGAVVLRSGLLAFIALLSGGAAAADRPVEVRNYIFGNSLIHHLTTSDETTVPHWLHRLALAAGKRYAADGQWGFLHNFAKDLPPIDQWAINSVPEVWSRDKSSFAEARFDTILINPANFIQNRPPNVPYHGDNPNGHTSLSATQAVFDWTASQQEGMRYFIYEGWSSMGPFSRRFPPQPTGLRDFHAFNRGKYHDWYVDYVRLVKESRPELDVRLIPVASVLSKLLTETPLRDLKPADLYSDLSPHGTATTYFLAAVITYSALFNNKAPESFEVPPSLHPLVKEHYAQIAQIVCTELLTGSECGSR
jgi:hypothetical protein